LYGLVAAAPLGFQCATGFVEKAARRAFGIIRAGERSFSGASLGKARSDDCFLNSHNGAIVAAQADRWLRRHERSC
jgi:hypothetical protein